MSDLSDAHYLSISRFPLEPSIGHLREDLLLVYDRVYSDSPKTQAFSDDEDDSQERDEELDTKDTISNLLAALQTHRVAKILRSQVSGGIVAAELATLFNRLISGKIDTEPFGDLIKAIIQKASDIEIWKRVLQLIVSISRLTPPPTTVSFGGTPRSTNSSSHQAFDQTKKLLEDALRDELWDCSYIKVSGFFEKYFDNKSWTQRGKDVYAAIKDTHLKTFPEHPTEIAVWSWWRDLQEKHLKDSCGIYYTTKSKQDMTGSDSEAQLDLLLKARSVTSETHDWADIRVIGELTISKDAQKFLQLARYARNVFSAQPRRRFIHAFLIAYTKVELCVFDRSGTYSAEAFDIQEEPERFLRIVDGYARMTDEELGLDTFIDREDGREFIEVTDESKGDDLKVQLELHAIARQAAVNGRGTSCYRTSDKKKVVKFSWVSTTRSPTEPDLLRLAHQRDVKGIPNLVGHRRITTTGQQREGLIFKEKRQLQSRLRSAASFSSRFASTQLSDGGILSRKRKSFDQDCPGLKKSRSNSQTSKLSQVIEADQPGDSSECFSLSRFIDPFVDRVLSCQVTSPAGRPLSTFGSVKELLQGFRDAIKVHRSLFFDGQILHRDVSEANMILTDPDENAGFHGMLIDLELGTVMENGKSTRTDGKRMTGTLKYMAIEVVEIALRDFQRDLEHTYRHDLESFLYVLISICISHGWGEGKAPKADPLQHWYVGSFESIARAKTGDMADFESYILANFSPGFQCVKTLAKDLRDLLFLRGQPPRKSTPVEPPSLLYDKTLEAYESAIKDLSD